MNFNMLHAGIKHQDYRVSHFHIQSRRMKIRTYTEPLNMQIRLTILFIEYGKLSFNHIYKHFKSIGNTLLTITIALYALEMTLWRLHWESTVGKTFVGFIFILFEYRSSTQIAAWTRTTFIILYFVDSRTKGYNIEKDNMNRVEFVFLSNEKYSN